jgi:hypothetical protein
MESLAFKEKAKCGGFLSAESACTRNTEIMQYFKVSNRRQTQTVGSYFRRFKTFGWYLPL